MDLDYLHEEPPDQAVKTLRNQTRELDDGQVHAYKEAALRTATEEGMDDHVDALEEAYWDDIVQHAREDYVADRTAAKEALYWHREHGLFDEYDVKDLCHHELDINQAYNDLADRVDEAGDLEAISDEPAYIVVQPAEVARRAATSDDHVINEVEQLQETLSVTYLDS